MKDLIPQKQQSSAAKTSKKKKTKKDKTLEMKDVFKSTYTKLYKEVDSAVDKGTAETFYNQYTSEIGNKNAVMFRCMPTRELIQRMVRKASKLDKDSILKEHYY